MKIPQAGFYPFWFWNGEQQEEEISRQIAEIADSGCKGVVIHSRVGNRIDYLSDRWLELVRFACEECAKYRLKVWIYDEDGFPSGNAGGRVQKIRPDLRQKSWKWTEKDGKLEFELFCEDSHVDTLHPDTVKIFLELTHEVYKKHLGDLFGTTIEAIYTDDESFLVWFCRNFVWSETLETEFQKAYGKSTREVLPALVHDLPESAEVRKCYSLTAQKLFIENFIRPQHEWCRKNGLVYTGHLSGDEGPRSRAIKNYTSAEAYYKAQDIPAVDDYLLDMKDLGYLRRPYTGDEFRIYPNGLEKCYPLYAYKIASSVANRSGVNQVSSEVWTFLGWNMPPEFLEGQTLFEIAMGQTLLTPHAFYYSLEGEAEQDCPPCYFFRQPYWPMLKQRIPVWTRLAEKTASSRAVADTLLVCPSFVELQNGDSINEKPDTALAHADEKLQRMILELMRRHIGFDLIDENEYQGDFGAMNYQNIIHADFSAFDTLSPLWELENAEEVLIQCRQDKDNSRWYFIQNLSGKEWQPTASFPDGMHVLYDPVRERAVFRGDKFPEKFRMAHGEMLLLLPDYQGDEIAFEHSEFCVMQENFSLPVPELPQGECGVFPVDLVFDGQYTCLEVTAENGVMEVTLNGGRPQVLWGSGRLSIAELCRPGENHLQIRFANSVGLLYGDSSQAYGIHAINLTR
jgi:hypothetical protein